MKQADKQTQRGIATEENGSISSIRKEIETIAASERVREREREREITII